METGIGGRLDATNIVNPVCSVITSIGLDHTDILGNTLEEIAYEKGGIIKNNTPCVIGPTVSNYQSINKLAKEKNSKLVTVQDQITHTEVNNKIV